MKNLYRLILDVAIEKGQDITDPDINTVKEHFSTVLTFKKGRL
jgi:hypothetical protein